MSSSAQHALRPAGKMRLQAGALFNLAFILTVLGMFVAGLYHPAMNTFSLIWSSILLEALPFMLLGSVLGGLIETLISSERMAELLPKKKWQTIMLSAGLGLVFPICECAIVPVVRRLARKGFPLGGVIAYLLGGPMVNVVVAGSTWLAYAGDWRIMVMRVGIGYSLAVIIGLIMARILDARQAFVKDVVEAAKSKHHQKTPKQNVCTCGHEHGHSPKTHNSKKNASSCGCKHEHEHKKQIQAGHTCGCGHAHLTADGWTGSLVRVLEHASEDFLTAGRYLLIGAFVAALANTFISREAFATLANLPAVSIIVMMILAVALNLCSEADAFIAASFRHLVPLSAQMAFLLLGPMLDLKLLLMYRTLFKPRAIVMLAGLIVVLVFVVAWLLSWGGA